MIFISAGHNTQKSAVTGKIDPGAVGNGFREADLTVELRDLITRQLDLMRVKYVTDLNNESLGEYLRRIQTGNASVVMELHFDSAASPAATGTTAIVEAEADRLDKLFATEASHITSCLLGIKNRGVITEAQSHRGSLGLMREEGIICLLEVGFISNPQDIARYHANKQTLAISLASLLKKYEDLIS